MPLIDLATGARFHYLDTGGHLPAVIVIHGLLGIPEKDFARLIDWLKPDYRVLAPSLRGFGESTPKPRVFPYDFYQRDAADVLAFMDALKIERAHLMGYSDGGEVALLAAGSAPERFLSAVVWGAVGYYGPAMRPVIQTYYPGDWITPEARAVHGITNPAAFILGWVQAVKRIIDSGGDLSLSLADKMTMPLLVMLGDQDRLNPVAYGQQLVARTPHGRLVMFSCGHSVHTEAWEEFKPVVSAFLAQAIS